jgi:hypothetical protein
MHVITRTLWTALLCAASASPQRVASPQAPQASIPVAGATASVSDTVAGRTGTQKKAALDSLEQKQSRALMQYRAFPVSFDSVFDTRTIGPSRIFNSNATGLSEVLRTWPQVVAVPFALSTGQSRYLQYGFPLLTNDVFLGDNAFGDCADAVHGTDGLFSTQVHDATWSPTGVRCAMEPAGLVSPHTDVLWENGVFLENLLGVRFVRPVTKTIDAGLYSNFRHLAPYNYNPANDIKSLYNYSFRDTTLLANGGRNPLSDESQITFNVASHPSNGPSSSVCYSYVDSKTDQAVQLRDSAADTAALRWRTVSRFTNILQASTHGVSLAPKVFVDIDGHAVLEGHRLYTPFVNSALVSENTGRNTDLRLSVEPYAVVGGADTVSVAARAGNKVQRLYDESEAHADVGDLRLGFRHGGSIGPFAFSLALSAGDGAVKAAGEKMRNDLVYSARGTVTAGGTQRISLFLLRDHLPFTLPYDSLSAPLESYEDAFQAYGADMFVGYGKVGLAAGVCAVQGIDTALAGRFWPDGRMPYGQGSYSLMVTPMIGRILGFALGSRTMLSDRRPYIKSQTTLSYQANPIFGREYITSDLLFDYWSARDPVSYAGISIWNREILNLSLATAVHIQGFCLFYKIDNILNRKYAYVPGYFMPGLTFRWGFQWLIPG